jgi:branched-chain amino acid transport system substrate-binding protein
MILVARQLRLTAVLAVIVLLFTACGATAPGTTGGSNASADKILVGAVIPITGRYAAGGEQVKNGYELAVEDINKAGGVDVGGRKIPLELNVLDDESDPTKTVQRLETLNSSSQVAAYLGGFGSDLHAAAAAIAEKNKIPYIGVAFALKKIHESGFKYLFSPFPKSPDLAVATFDLLDSLNPKPTKVAIFAEKTDWGAEMRGLWNEQAKKRGYTVAADQEYAPGSKDFAPVILAAKDAGAEVVLALPNPPDGLALAKQMKELDFNAKFYMFVRAADGPTWAQNLGKDGDSFMLMPGWNAAVKFAGVEGMVQRYQAKYNKPAQATTGSAYAAVQILADAITRAGSLDRDKIRDAIAATDMMTVAGPVKFNADGTGQVITIINQWQDGKQVLIWPPDQAAGKLTYPAKPWKER